MKQKHFELGPSYGGPSISYEDGQYVVYYWFDAPVGMEIIGQGKSITAALKDAQLNRK